MVQRCYNTVSMRESNVNFAQLVPKKALIRPFFHKKSIYLPDFIRMDKP